MCVRMLNPKKNEYIMDPAWLRRVSLHAMEWCYPALIRMSVNQESIVMQQNTYGIDFEERAAKTSRALMLIAGDGHTNIFGPDVNSLDPKTWYETQSGQKINV